MNSADHSAAPAAPAEGAARIYVVFGVDEADADAKLAALAGPDGPGPLDDVVVIRWMSEGETPPGQIQMKSPSDAPSTADARPAAITGPGPSEGDAGK